MARAQTAYRPQGTGLQAVGLPTIQTEVARNDPNADSAYQLAKSLGAINAEGLTQSARNATKAYEQAAEEDARAYANSMTLEGLGKAIKDGAILPSQSPAFKATVEHIYGENTLDAFQRDTASKLSKGELKFNNQADLDKYITDARNTALAGASPFTISGFDRGYNQAKESLLNANTRVVDGEAVQRGVQEATDNIGNVILDVSSPEFKGTPQDAAKVILDRYQMLGKTSLLRDDARKEALMGAVTSIASSGNQGLTSAMLDSKLDNGVTVRAVLGEPKSISLTQAAERKFDQAQSQRVDVERRPFLEQADRGELNRKGFEAWVSANEKYVSTATVMSVINQDEAAKDRLQQMIRQHQAQMAADSSVALAQQATFSAIDQGRLSSLPQMQVLTASGETKTYNASEAAVPYLQMKSQDLPFGKQVELWSSNSVVNPNWQNVVQSGVTNLASVGWTYDGKKIGDLNPQGQDAMDMFIRINKVNPAYAQQMAGKEYNSLSDIQFLAEHANMNLSDAAARVNQIQRANLDGVSSAATTARVNAAVNDVVNPGFFSGMAQRWNSLWGNSDVNLMSVRGELNRMTELLVKSGQVPDVNSALKASAEYLSNPKITTKINNTVYLNKDLPTFPAGSNTEDLMDRFIKTVPGSIQGYSPSTVRLEPNAFGGFQAWSGATPVVNPEGNIVHYTKEDISRWADDTVKADRYAAAEKAARSLQINRDNAKALQRHGHLATFDGVDVRSFGELPTTPEERKAVADESFNAIQQLP